MSETDLLKSQAARLIARGEYREAMERVAAGSGDLTVLALLALAHEVGVLNYAVVQATATANSEASQPSPSLQTSPVAAGERGQDAQSD